MLLLLHGLVGGSETGLVASCSLPKHMHNYVVTMVTIKCVGGVMTLVRNKALRVEIHKSDWLDEKHFLNFLLVPLGVHPYTH